MSFIMSLTVFFSFVTSFLFRNFIQFEMKSKILPSFFYVLSDYIKFDSIARIELVLLGFFSHCYSVLHIVTIFV